MNCAAVIRNPRSESIGSYDAYRELVEPSSIDLLRTSIIRSIRSREVESQGFHERKYDGSTANQTENSSTVKYAVVEVEHFNRRDSSFSDEYESDLSNVEQTNSRDEQQRVQPSEEKTEIPDILEESSFSNSLSVDSLELKEHSTDDETRDDWMMVNHNKGEDTKERKESDTNSLKLARRTFSNSIFEDCSTYDITCPSVDLYEEDEDSNHPNIDSLNIESVSAHSVTIDTPVVSKKEVSFFPTSWTSTVENSEEQTSLCDTFFSHVTSGECQSPTLSPSSMFTDARSSLVEKDVNTAESLNNGSEENGQSTVVPSKRRHSRRHRRRSRKKSKSKKSFVYECSKCGISYVIPTRGMNNVACCLHCDLWTPVEPVFVKREKTTWNTCCIS